MSRITDRIREAVREYDPHKEATGLRVHFTAQVRRKMLEQEGWDPLRVEYAAPQPEWARRTQIVDVVVDERVPEGTVLLRQADGRVVAVVDLRETDGC